MHLTCMTTLNSSAGVSRCRDQGSGAGVALKAVGPCRDLGCRDWGSGTRVRIKAIGYCKRGCRRVLCHTESRRSTPTTPGNTANDTRLHDTVTGAPARVTERDASTQQPTSTWTRGGGEPPTTMGCCCTTARLQLCMCRPADLGGIWRWCWGPFTHALRSSGDCPQSVAEGIWAAVSRSKRCRRACSLWSCRPAAG